MSTIFLRYLDQALPIRVLEHPKVKTLRLSCSLGGDLLLTLPPGMPRAQVYDFLEEHRSLIGERALAARRKAERLPPEDQEHFPWLGENLPILRQEGSRNQAQLKAGQVILTLKKGEWGHDALTRLRQRMAVPELTRMAEARAKELGLAPVTVSVRPMLSRFGSCQIIKRHLCLNSYLTRMKSDIVLAVIDHELCHLVHSGHNSAFYSTLSRFDPLYAQHRSVLRRELSPYLNYIRLESKARRPHPALNDFSSPIL